MATMSLAGHHYYQPHKGVCDSVHRGWETQVPPGQVARTYPPGRHATHSPPPPGHVRKGPNPLVRKVGDLNPSSQEGPEEGSVRTEALVSLIMRGLSCTLNYYSRTPKYTATLLAGRHPIWVRTFPTAAY